MVAHVVLCTLRRDLSGGDRERFAHAIRAAFDAIPAIRRSALGRRLQPGIPYGGAADTEYDYVAVLEFDDEAALRGYLEHPAHAKLASLFWSCCARTLIADYHLGDPAALSDSFSS